jgi:opacity protein-like surface antigen
MIRRSVFAACAAGALLTGAPAFAQEVTPDWKVSVTPYLWVTSYDNDISDKRTGNGSSSSMDFSDILEDLSGVFLGKGEVQYQRFGVFADLVYMKLTSDSTTTRPILGPISTEVEAATTSSTVAAYYRVVENDQLNLDLLGGVRYVDLDIELDARAVGPGVSRGLSASLTEPIIGVRAKQRIGQRSSLSGYADYGGFSDDATVWQVYGAYDYQWTPNWIASFGYRYFAVEVETTRLRSEVTFSGPVIGMTYTF